VNPFVFTVDRYIFITLTSWIILGAIAIKELFCRVQGIGKVLASGVLFLLVADAAGMYLMYYQFNHGNRPDWRTAFDYVQERRAENDVVVSAVDRIGTYYMNEDVMALGDIEPDVISSGNTKFWFVLDSENSWWSDKEKQWVEESSDLIEAWHLRTKENMYLRVYLYDPARHADTE
jgi:hypothetical protein